MGQKDHQEELNLDSKLRVFFSLNPSPNWHMADKSIHLTRFLAILVLKVPNVACAFLILPLSPPSLPPTWMKMNHPMVGIDHQMITMIILVHSPSMATSHDYGSTTCGDSVLHPALSVATSCGYGSITCRCSVLCPTNALSAATSHDYGSTTYRCSVLCPANTTSCIYESLGSTSSRCFVLHPHPQYAGPPVGASAFSPQWAPAQIGSVVNISTGQHMDL